MLELLAAGEILAIVCFRCAPYIFPPSNAIAGAFSWLTLSLSSLGINEEVTQIKKLELTQYIHSANSPTISSTRWTVVLFSVIEGEVFIGCFSEAAPHPWLRFLALGVTSYDALLSDPSRPGWRAFVNLRFGFICRNNFSQQFLSWNILSRSHIHHTTWMVMRERERPSRASGYYCGERLVNWLNPLPTVICG